MRPFKMTLALMVLATVGLAGVSRANAASDDLTLSQDENAPADKLSEALSVKAIDGELSEADKLSYDQVRTEATGESQSLRKEMTSLDSQVRTLKDGAERSKKAAHQAQREVEIGKSRVSSAKKTLAQAKTARARAEELNKKLKASDRDLGQRLKDTQIAAGETKRAIDQLNRENNVLKVRIDRNTKQLAIERKRLTDLRAKRARVSAEHKRLAARAESSR